VGIAVDTPEGLFVPVLRDVNHRTMVDLRKGLKNLREAVATRKIPPTEMQGATITLSNFGTMTGQYANPIVSPPQVAIVGAGAIREKVVPYHGKPAVRRILPLSITFDHRAVTGGEASRFLGALIAALEAA
jgi:pyruvate dehydrogenase E2 component (dihydrolipoamide acetyltransferase)